MPIPQSFLDEVVMRSDIVDIVSSYVKLTKKSGGSMLGLCPFHSEKTPSFNVRADKQVYHCFGCGVGGGVISFVREIEALEFRDAVEFLAKRAGMQMPEDDTPVEDVNRRKRAFDLNREAARYYHELLHSPKGARAARYMERRGITKQIATRFGLGAAPDGWNTLSDEMRARGFSEQDLIDAGLCKRGSKGGVYDLFRDRLMFPVIDVRGNVIGFSGRILSDGEPKYLNSPETVIFNKSRNLFAMNLAKKTKRGMLILAEGNIDVISLHQAGFDCAVASLGTSLTDEQARLIKRYTENVVISYDGDAAGVKAAERAIGILDKVGLNIRVLRVKDAKDPDEFIKKFGADAFKLLLERSEGDTEYRLSEIKRASELETDEGRLAYLDKAEELLARLPNAAEREVYGRRVAESAGVSFEAVDSEVAKKRRAFAKRDKNQQQRAELRPTAQLQPRERTERYDSVPSVQAEKVILQCLITDASLISVTKEMKLASEEFTLPANAKVYQYILGRSPDTPVSSAQLMAGLEPNEAAVAAAILAEPITVTNSEQAVRDCVERVRVERAKGKPVGEDDIMELYRLKKEKEGLGGIS
ncbi:MAG: DNA primase [Oscillospiraceae bacterium]|jgi:DNA primase|nr:DNA primase [Oscillospiraceae bacterium]